MPDRLALKPTRQPDPAAASEDRPARAPCQRPPQALQIAFLDGIFDQIVTVYLVNGIRLAGTVKQHAFTVIPPFSLPDRQGKRVSPWDYKHRQSVVLLFCADTEGPLLRNFARQYRAYAYREAGAERLAILLASPDLEEFPFPVLIDQDRHLTTRRVECTPAV